MSSRSDVLVVGAGPTGLTAALQAHDHGARVRVVERREQLFRPSRAMIVHPHTLESLRPLGVTDALLDRADTSPSARLHLGRRRVAADLARVDWPGTAFPHLSLVRQADVEEVLAGALEQRGVAVERGTEVVALSPAPDGGRARVVLRCDDRSVEATPRFVVGCDGPASTVRNAAGIGWRGGSYGEEVVLADVELRGDLEPGLLHVVAGRRGLVFVFALGEGATWRVLATRPTRGGDAPFGQPTEGASATDVRRLVEDAGLPARVTEVGWTSRVRLQHRVADAFRRGGLFLAGDAAHAHSPAAAQGMNTGILDAVNLGWKLGLATGTKDTGALLDSYEQERRPVARQVLALTHAVFFAEASTHPLPALLRSRVVPLAAPALPLLLGRPRLLGLVVRLLSQQWVRYRHSVLSVEGVPRAAHGPRPGDRLPDRTVVSGGRPQELHALTAGPGVHLLLARDAEPVDPALLGPLVRAHRLEDRPGRDVVAVRPDGYVGFRCAETDPAQLTRWLDLVGATAAGPRRRRGGRS